MHHILDKKVNNLEATGVYDDVEIENLKKQRLLFKDEIATLKHKQEEQNRRTEMKNSGFEE